MSGCLKIDLIKLNKEMVTIKILICLGLYLLLCTCLAFSDCKLVIDNKKITNKFERFYFYIGLLPIIIIIIIFAVLMLLFIIAIFIFLLGIPLWIVIAILVVAF